jgi:hypothetical protein
MEFFILLTAVLFTMASSLGVGSSTIAILNFFVAIRDGVIDPTERAMMSIVYVVLRVAMIALFLTLSILTASAFYHSGSAALTSTLIIQWAALGVLYLNAILMTLRIMPSKFGPAIQASSWYTLGLVTTLASLGITMSVAGYTCFYLTLMATATILINGVMQYLKKKQAPAPTLSTPAK